ncbi:UNVERIFIED_CONTAM: hypothetical protein FKN15_003610 [Acipenser sinensis]
MNQTAGVSNSISRGSSAKGPKGICPTVHRWASLYSGTRNNCGPVDPYHTGTEVPTRSIPGTVPYRTGTNVTTPVPHRPDTVPVLTHYRPGLTFPVRYQDGLVQA